MCVCMYACMCRKGSFCATGRVFLCRHTRKVGRKVKGRRGKGADDRRLILSIGDILRHEAHNRKRESRDAMAEEGLVAYSNTCGRWSRVPPTGADAPLFGWNFWSARDAGHRLEVLTRLFLLPTATASSASLPSPRDPSSTKHLGNQRRGGVCSDLFCGGDCRGG